MAWIGVGGYATAGKDAFADVLEGQAFYRTAMSAPLNNALMVLNPYVRDEHGYVARYAQFVNMRGYEGAKKIPEVRRLLQVLGTEVGRNMLYENVWVDAAYKSLEGWDNAVLTGIRYVNELSAIRKHGGTLVWIRRPGVGPVNGHTSDNSLTELDFDVVIDNDGTLDDLKSKALAFLKRLGVEVV